MSAEGFSNLPGLRKSIRRTAATATRKRINSEATATASPTFPTKRKRAVTTSGDEPRAKRMAAERDILAGLAALQASMAEMNKKFDSIPNREDFDKIEGTVQSMRREIANNNSRLDMIAHKQSEDKRDFVRNVERVIDTRLAYHKSLRSGVLTPTAGEAEKERLFLVARRSMLLWPVDLTAEAGNAVRKFMENTLEMPVATVKSINIEQVDKVEQARRSRIVNEVKVVFATSRERDIVQSFASNLAKANGKAGIRMELPEHLRGLFKIFEAHGASLRQRFPGLKRSIKYDDSTQSLCMDVKMPDKDTWHRLNEIEMREISKRYSAVKQSQDGLKSGDEEDRQLIRSVEGAAAVPVVPVDEDDNQ